MTDIRDKISEILVAPQLGVLATVTEDGRPWARYVMVAAGDHQTLKFATFRSSRKVAQIQKNPEVHLTLGVSTPEEAERYLQIEARAKVSAAKEDRHSYWHEGLTTYFDGPDDPNYCVVTLEPYRYELMTLGRMEPEVWEP